MVKFIHSKRLEKRLKGVDYKLIRNIVSCLPIDKSCHFIEVVCQKVCQGKTNAYKEITIQMNAGKENYKFAKYYYVDVEMIYNNVEYYSRYVFSAMSVKSLLEIFACDKIEKLTALL